MIYGVIWTTDHLIHNKVWLTLHWNISLLLLNITIVITVGEMIESKQEQTYKEYQFDIHFNTGFVLFK